MNISKTMSLPGWLSLNEGRLLYDLVKTTPRNGEVVEIGSFQGKSTIFIASALKNLNRPAMFSIDPHVGQTHVGKKEFSPTFVSFQRNIKNAGISKYVTAIRKTSAAAAKTWKKPIAFLNVDGLHEYKFIKEDLTLWSPFIVDGGVVVCHDAFSPFPDVFCAIKEEIFSTGDYRYVGVNDSQFFAVKGRPRNIFEELNFERSKFFLILASRIWSNNALPKSLRFIIVNRILKIFFMNKFLWRNMTHNFVKKVY